MQITNVEITWIDNAAIDVEVTAEEGIPDDGVYLGSAPDTSHTFRLDVRDHPELSALADSVKATVTPILRQRVDDWFRPG